MVVSRASRRRQNLCPLPLFDDVCLNEEFKAHNIKTVHCSKILRYVIKRGAQNWEDIPGLPHAAYQLLSEKFAVCTSKVLRRQDSLDGSTTKLLICLQDGSCIEAVVMRYGAVELSSFPEDLKGKNTQEAASGKTRPFKSSTRATLCVSSQVGCQMGCTFCATGTMGLSTNLTSGEILEQLYHASRIESIRNVVFMGMGEPLDNYAEVVGAIRGMMDVCRFNLSSHRISVSTVGVAPKIKQLVKDIPGVSLALSLHAPNQLLRTQLVPSSRAWHIDSIMSSVDTFATEQRRQSLSSQKRKIILVEYVLIDGVNDSDEVAHELGRLLKSRVEYMMLNVIPYNPVDIPTDYRPPSRAVTDRFMSVVRSYGVTLTIRQELGQDILSACGQLAVKQKEGASLKKLKSLPPKEIEDLPLTNDTAMTRSALHTTPAALKHTSNERHSDVKFPSYSSTEELHTSKENDQPTASPTVESAESFATESTPLSLYVHPSLKAFLSSITRKASHLWSYEELCVLVGLGLPLVLAGSFLWRRAGSLLFR